ncbi:MAG: hypothetical protein ACREUT_08090 [Steroidobacteraceae bacterium]
MKLGLLMETAQSHQKLAEAAIGRLNEYTQELEAVARDQIRQALAKELTAVRAEIQGAIRSLEALKRAANARTTLWTIGCGAIAVTIALLVAWWFLPKPAEIGALRAEREELASNIAMLDRYGARADLRRCGAGRVCVRVDLKAPRYGDHADYLVIRGY